MPRCCRGSDVVVGRNRFIAAISLANGRNALGLAKRRNKAIAPYNPFHGEATETAAACGRTGVPDVIHASLLPWE